MSEKKEFISGFNWNTATVVLQIIIQTVYTGLLARLVNADAFALMGIVLSIVGFAELFSQVGIGPALIQRKELHPQHLSGAFYTALLLGLLFTAGFIAVAPAIAAYYGDERLEPIIRVVSSSFTIAALAVVPRNLMLKKMDFKGYFIAGMISIVGGNLIVGLVLAYMGYGVWAYVWALFAQNALMTICYWYFERTRFPLAWQWKYTRELIRYGGSSTLFNALNYAATKVDVTIVPKFATTLPHATTPENALFRAGVYERSAYVMSLPITIMAKLSDNVLFSGMSKMQDETERLRRVILTAMHMLGFITIPAIVLAVFTAPSLVQIYLGDQYTEAGPVLRILFIAVIFRTLSRLADSLLRAKNAVLRGSVYKALYLLLMIIGVYTAVPYGLQAVAVAIAATTGIHFMMSVYLTQRLIGTEVQTQLRALVPGIILGLLPALPLTALLFLLPRQPALIEFLLFSGVWAITVMIVIYTRPRLLSFQGQNPLLLFPQKLQRLPLIRSAIKKLDTKS